MLRVAEWCAFAAAGARLPLAAAPAPGPAAGAAGKAVDLHFVISANKATFKSDNTVTFTNVSQTAQFVANSGRSGGVPLLCLSLCSGVVCPERINPAGLRCSCV